MRRLSRRHRAVTQRLSRRSPPRKIRRSGSRARTYATRSRGSSRSIRGFPSSSRTRPATSSFPSVGKAGLGIGGAHGNGEVFESGKVIGKASMTQVTIGLQLGGQEYSEAIFFDRDSDLEDFTAGRLELAAQVSAVALSAGAAAGADYRNGVVVFTRTKAGLMAEASVGGQKFSYEPY